MQISALLLLSSLTIGTGTCCGAGPIRFELCHLPSGSSAGPIEDMGFNIKGYALIVKEEIGQILPLEDVSQCCLLVLRSGQQAAVIGTEHNLLCRIYGGDNCKWEHNE